MTISEIINLLKTSDFTFAYNKDNHFYYINNNPISQKLKEEDVQNVYKYIINIDNVIYNDLIMLSKSLIKPDLALLSIR